MPKTVVNFTQKVLEAIPTPQKATYYYDKKVNGLLLCVTANGVKSYQVYARPKGKNPVRVTLGRFPNMKIEQARKRAKAELATLAEGVNPNSLRKAERTKLITLQQVFEDYLTTRKALKPGTIKDYRRVLDESFDDWKTKPLAKITRDMVEKRHTKRGKQSEARANNAMRVLRALFNFAQEKYENENGDPIFTDNPVKRLSHTKAWFRVDRRRRDIKAHQLKQWFAAVNSLGEKEKDEKEDFFENRLVFRKTVRDYLVFLLLTGLRRGEAARLKWENVDFVGKTFTVLDTKNQDPLCLPLTDHLLEMLQTRQKESESQYVFPSEQSKTGHIINAVKQLNKVKTRSGIEFSAHDLRRTFATIAENRDISAYALKRLLNHKMKHDVTAGYINIDVERLRKPMQQITDYILISAEIKPKAEVVELKQQTI
ncbi:MAG: tyrosine-type recombinase/integrase [Gammaproteobacteria bacterium]|nr:tyrosine-type recombinase/integrase [Gammaproteobacteria bacterium]MDH5799623.1 tyrosine-type recombinase/integrase [Gammaproteobacteria bacterium]